MKKLNLMMSLMALIAVMNMAPALGAYKDPYMIPPPDDEKQPSEQSTVVSPYWEPDRRDNIYHGPYVFPHRYAPTILYGSSRRSTSLPLGAFDYGYSSSRDVYMYNPFRPKPPMSPGGMRPGGGFGPSFGHGPAKPPGGMPHGPNGRR